MEKPIVMIVEDDVDVREALELVAQQQGFDVITASHGVDALRMLRELSRQPSLILLDLMMPVMDGREFLAKRAGGERDIPVVVLTAHRNAVVPDATRVLAKPVSLDALVDVLRPYWR